MTKNLALESLDCSGNSIPSLNVVNNTALRTLNCSKNNLIKINVTANTAIEDFDISGNCLSAINLRSNTALKKLNLSYNKEISLVDLRNNTELTHLYVRRLNLSELDLTKIAQLQVLNVLENPILSRVICPSMGWLSNVVLIDRYSTIYVLPDGGEIVEGNIEVDGRIWKKYNAGSSSDNHYGGIYASCVNPCPSGWRVPYYSELSSLSANYSEITTLNGMKGRWFSGSQIYSDSIPAVFLPVLKDSSYFVGCYWSYSVKSSENYYYLNFNNSKVGIDGGYYTKKYSVRCIKNE